MKSLVATWFIALAVLGGAPTFTLAKTVPAIEPINNNSLSASSSYHRVLARSYRTHSVYLRRGHADITISGDGETDLDLYVYDRNGNLVAHREGYTDYEGVCLDVFRGGYFTVKVVNRGRVYNDYQLAIE